MIHQLQGLVGMADYAPNVASLPRSLRNQSSSRKEAIALPVRKYIRGAIQQLRGQNFAIF